jgi:DNA-binding transcriptional LysR family regulator
VALGGTDLNLLVALQALLEEENVTRAGAKVGMGQPAMSASLARLRRHFKDELLVRAGRDYELTPFARSLLPSVQRAVFSIGEALDLSGAFDPATSDRRFRFAMSDYCATVLMGPLRRRVSALAPRVTISVGGLPDDVHRSDHALVRNDVVIGPLGFGLPGLVEPLFTDRFVAVADRRSTVLPEGPVTLEQLAALPMASTTFGTGVLTPVDRLFGTAGLAWTPTAKVAGFSALPFIVEGTDLVAAVPCRLAARILDGTTLRTFPSPFDDVELLEAMWYRKAASEDDDGLKWLLAQLREVGAEVSAETGAA